MINISLKKKHGYNVGRRTTRKRHIGYANEKGARRAPVYREEKEKSEKNRFLTSKMKRTDQMYAYGT